MEGNLRFKTDWAKALCLEGNLPFLLCFTLYLRASSKYKPLAGAVSNRLLPLGSLNLEGRFNRQFFALRVWGAYIWSRLIHGGAYSWNFTVFLKMFSV